MLQIGSCHFEPESVSQSFDDDYSYSSEMFPPIIKSFMGQSKENGGDVANDIQSEAGRNAILHQRRLNHINRQNPDQQNQQKGISNFFVSANRGYLCHSLHSAILTNSSNQYAPVIFILVRTKPSAAADKCSTECASST